MGAPANHTQPGPAAPAPSQEGRAGPLLELRDVAVASAEAPKSALLRGVNWTVTQGEFWVVGGLPGSGKSQLLQTAAGLLPPRAGAVRFFGRELAGTSAADLVRTRRRIGFVFADGGRLFNGLTVAQNVALPLCYHLDCQPEAVSEAVEALLAITELKPLAGRLPARIHRAWRQRLALARALALGPELLLLDNPTAGLDRRQVRWWVEFLVQLSAGGAGRPLEAPQNANLDRANSSGAPAINQPLAAYNSAIQQIENLRHEAGRPEGPRTVGQRPPTVVVATDELRPWLSAARQFAFLKADQWQPLGGAADVLASAEPMLREMLAEPAPTG
jgi:ABC-type transporter Mla maintaining outer membrane lipid asymmetry ATPase subunit MlaF